MNPGDLVAGEHYTHSYSGRLLIFAGTLPRGRNSEFIFLVDHPARRVTLHLEDLMNLSSPYVYQEAI